MAGFFFTIVNQQPFFMLIPGTFGTSVVEKAVALSAPREVERHRAATFDGFGQDLPDGVEQARTFGDRKPAGGFAGRDAGPMERL